MIADLFLRYDIVKKLGHFGLTEKFMKYMRLTVSEKQEIIQMVTRSEIGVNRTLRALESTKVLFAIGIMPSAKCC
jgi:hypothetical protein